MVTGYWVFSLYCRPKVERSVKDSLSSQLSLSPLLNEPAGELICFSSSCKFKLFDCSVFVRSLFCGFQLYTMGLFGLLRCGGGGRSTEGGSGGVGGWLWRSVWCTCARFSCYGAKTTLDRRASSCPHCQWTAIGNICNLLVFQLLLFWPRLIHLQRNSPQNH